MSNLKTVLITGCSAGGIGHELAKEYHAKGLRVFATARRLSSMEALQKLGIECLELDATEIDNIKQVRDHVANSCGSLDILVNNAGQLHFAVPAIDIKIDEVKAMFDVNLFAVFTMVQEFVHLLIASGNGRIVNIGSIAAVFPLPFSSVYNASKAALHAYGNTLRVELEPFNIKVITVVTGGVRSNIMSRNRDIHPDSLYFPLSKDLEKKRKGRPPGEDMNMTPSDVYARFVAAATLKASPKAWLWAGNFSWLTWFFDTFFPRTIWDVIVAKLYCLTAFKQKLLSQKKIS